MLSQESILLGLWIPCKRMKSNQLGQLGTATVTITASSVEGLSRSGERVTGNRRSTPAGAKVNDERLTVNGFALQNRTNLLVFDWIIKFLGGKAVGDCGLKCLWHG